jgi:phosphonate metabolism protein (transferase hexapeptide repeat family)
VSGGTFIESLNLPPPVRLGAAPCIAPDAIIRASRFGAYTEVGTATRIEHSVFGDYSYIGHHGDVMAADIGKFANIASMVRINPGFHPTERPCQHHILYRGSMYGVGADDPELFHWRQLQRVTIGHDTWIGHGAVIMPGVTVGNGAVVGSGSIVTRDVAPYTIVAGSPARPIRPRFSPAIAAAVEKVAWWDWDHATLAARLDDLRDMRHFLARYVDMPQEA